ncbi:helix-turn-helix transcriptional regulator [Microbacterium phyllosphaerae]|uniref:helix-turn-helix transcriptional regulator n=1 Tax=Microbacterium phyllosphaerae TaxID=124798 RepID=UPI002167C81F|nr:LuxR C-terminal-related transcriptional regulator [Microbacterium phyllosphaerae]MCS3441589.1 DNA-binding CsgD family transcriptional regulator [Microbacterium phyllosphaerae]
MEGILEDLLENELSCAPHVVARIVAEVTADRSSVRDVAARLDPAQRAGLRPLPMPLPMVGGIEALYSGLAVDPRDHDLLVAISLRLDDRLDPLLDFDGRTAADIAAGPIGPLIHMHAGRVQLSDPRLAIWLRATTSTTSAARVHRRLHRVFHHRGERVDADWHRARASTGLDPTTANELTRIAREHSEAGLSERAFHLAAEAAAHAVGADRDEATLVAGVAAIAAGYAVEAARRLAGLFPGGDERYRMQGLGGLFVAQAHLRGAVPEVDLGALRPRGDDPEHWYSWARAAAFAAVLCAERGDRQGMRSWLEALREGTERTSAEHELRDPVVALAWLVLGDHDVDDVRGAGPLTGGMLQALHAAIDGDVDHGLRILAVGDSGIGVEVDPFVAGFEASPLVGAYRAVVEVLLLMWRGDMGAARDRMIRAALELPVAIPFAGLGVVIARRLDLAVLGRLGPFARSLTAALPAPVRIDQLVDRGIEAFLDGASEEAASCMRVWRDRGAPQPTLSVPGLEEAIVVTEPALRHRHRIEPPEIALAQQLRLRITGCSDDDWRVERDRVVAETRTLTSPFSRGRVEAMIGTRSLIRGDVELGREHLATAVKLLELSGADAWARAVEVRLRRLGTQDRPTVVVGDPLASCRRVWRSMLTSREFDVAMLVVEGSSNRDIADSLHVSVRTVEVHLGRVFAKLEVRTRVELTVLAHRIGQYV